MKQLRSKGLDQLDLALLRELEIDAGQTDLHLAAKLGSSPTTVRRRLRTLSDEHVTKLIAMTNPSAVGYRIWAVFVMNALPGKVESVARQLATLGNVMHVFMTSGRYDIVIHAVFRGNRDLLDFVTLRLGSISEIETGILNTEVILSLKLVKQSWAYLGPDNYASGQKRISRDLDALDLSIIKELEADPGQTNTNLAKRLGGSRSSVRRRLEKLLTEKTIRVVNVVEPSALGYNIMATILLKVHPNRAFAVAEEASRLQNVKHVFIGVGSFDVYVWGIFQDLTDLYSFVGGQLGQILGVTRCETMIHLKEKKRSFALLQHKE